jgi:hypothetical protein
VEVVVARDVHLVQGERRPGAYALQRSARVVAQMAAGTAIER